MSLASQFRALATQTAIMRQQLFGATEDGTPVLLDYDEGTKVEGYFTPVRNQRQLDETGMHGQHDTIARIQKCNLPVVQLGKTLALTMPDGTQQLVRIAEFGNHAAGVEWVLGCSAL